MLVPARAPAGAFQDTACLFQTVPSYLLNSGTLNILASDELITLMLTVILIRSTVAMATWRAVDVLDFCMWDGLTHVLNIALSGLKNVR